MCGITGIVYTDRFGEPNDIKRMSDAIAHRGPDGEGFLAINSRTRLTTPLSGKKTPISLPSLEEYQGEANVYLAHRRLSIIDLSASGHQPMSNTDGTLWITFNGEIYNYKAIRAELKDDGFTFRSDCDTEVLLYAYEKWGEGCLDRLDGMFAFVIYDKRRNILFGARDRFGVKPLYYYCSKEAFAFSSEIKGLVALDFVPRRVNKKVAYSYLSFYLEYYGSETFFDDIMELPPAHSFSYDLTTFSFSVSRYYELRCNPRWERFNDKKNVEYIQDVRALLRESVEAHLNADVSVGSCLSGGIDSSAIVSMIHDIRGGGQACVTACYNQSWIDESKWAKIVADSVGAQWHRVFPKQNELLEDMEDLVYAQEMPVGGASLYAQYRVMRTARENGITVLLDGQGGDELFCGYPHYYNNYYLTALRNADLNGLIHESRHTGNSPLADGFPVFIAKALTIDFMHHLPARVYNTARRKTLDLQKGYKNFKARPIPFEYTTNLNEDLLIASTRTSLPVLLRYEDKNSMRFSIESRTPFADSRKLIEYLFSIPASYKIHDGWSKHLLREAMDGIMPQQIKTRVDKVGFETPESDWIGGLKPLVFTGKNTGIEQYINIGLLEQNWDELTSKNKDRSQTKLFRYLTFIIWFKRFGCS